MAAITVTRPNPTPRPEHEVVTEVLAAVKADVHPMVIGVEGYAHLMACLEHVGRRYGVQS